MRRVRSLTLDESAHHALLEMPLDVCAVRRAWIVGHHDDRLAEIDVERLDQVENLFRASRIQISRRLIGDEQQDR